MNYDAIARRYARAIFDLGKEEGSLTALATQISDFARTYGESRDLQSVLADPTVPEAAKKAIVVDIATRLGITGTGERSLRVIAQRRRLRALPDIAKHLQRLVDEDARVLRAVVTSAGPLTESYLTKLKGELEKATGQKVILTHEVDPSLIAGIVTKVGDRVVDGSAVSRLRALRDATSLN